MVAQITATTNCNRAVIANYVSRLADALLGATWSCSALTSRMTPLMKTGFHRPATIPSISWQTTRDSLLPHNAQPRSTGPATEIHNSQLDQMKYGCSSAWRAQTPRRPACRTRRQIDHKTSFLVSHLWPMHADDYGALKSHHVPGLPILINGTIVFFTFLVDNQFHASFHRPPVSITCSLCNT